MDWGSFRVFCHVLLFAVTISGQAQQMVHTRFSAADGLPSNKLYSISEDGRGFLWFATDFGMSRFNGATFKNHEQGPGVKRLGFFTALSDKKGKMWFINNAGHICELRNEVIHRADSMNIPDDYYVLWMFEDDRGNYWMTCKGGHVVKVNNKGESFLYTPFTESVAYGICIPGKGILIRQLGRFALLDYDGRIKKEWDAPWANWTRFFSLNDGRIALTNETGINILDTTDFSFHLWIPHDQHFPLGEVIHLFEDDEGDLWAGTHNGLFFFDTRKSPFSVQHYLQGEFVTWTRQDYEGNIWTSTFNGLYRVVSKHVWHYPDRVVSPMDFALYRNRVVSISDSGTLYWLGLRGPRLFSRIPNYLESVARHSLVADPDGEHLWFSSYYHLFHFDADGTQHKLADMKWPIGFLESEKHGMFVFHENLCAITSQGKVIPSAIPDSRPLTETFRDMIEGRDGAVWRASPEGLDRFRLHAACWEWDTSFFVGYASDVEEDRAGRIWVATAGKGIACVDHDKLFFYGTAQGLPSQYCFRVSVDNDGDVWAFSKEGLFSFTADEGKVISFRNFSAEGVVPSYLQGFILHGDTVFVSSKEGGVHVFNHKELTAEAIAVPVFFTSVVIEDREAEMSAPTLYNGERLFVSYEAVAYRNSKDIIFQYRLEGRDSAWLSTTSGRLDFVGLAPGNYTLQVRALRKGLGMSQQFQTASLSVDVLPLWWQTWWFRLSVVFVLIAGGISWIHIHIRSIRNRAAKESKLLQAELRVLRTQMNPHFIFNSLHSIQKFIFSADPQPANSYLSRLAMLMRKMVDYSSLEHITLEEEIEFLELYLQMEQLRFPENFEYQIKTGKGLVASEHDIPPVLVQPLVENAIHHGLNGLDRPGKLIITFMEKEGGLCCVVEDNGRGREAAEKRKMPGDGHNSTGIKNVNVRLSLLRNRHSENMGEPVWFENLYGPGHEPCGTRVTLFIPAFATPSKTNER